MGVRGEVGSIPALDGVRGVAVLWVVAFHYTVLAAPQDAWLQALARVPAVEGLARHGYLGVDLFFLLSGFLLAMPWLSRARRGLAPPGARAFYRRRVLRIVPAYYVHLVLLFGCFLPLLGGWLYWRSDAYVVAWNAIAHAAFLQLTSPLTSAALGANGALWTLAIEAQFYLLLPWVAPLFVRAPLRCAVGALLVSAGWRWAAAHDLAPLVALQLRLGAHWHWPEGVVRHLLVTQLPSYLGHFALGALLAAAGLRRRERAPTRAANGAMVLLGLAGFALLLHATSSTRASWGELDWLLPAVALAMLLAAAALGRGAIARRALGGDPLAFVGRVSYSAYLYHLPLLLVLRRHAAFDGLGFAAAYLVLVLAAAWASWRWVERPFLGPAPPRFLTRDMHAAAPRP